MNTALREKLWIYGWHIVTYVDTYGLVCSCQVPSTLACGAGSKPASAGLSSRCMHCSKPSLAISLPSPVLSVWYGAAFTWFQVVSVFTAHFFLLCSPVSALDAQGSDPAKHLEHSEVPLVRTAACSVVLCWTVALDGSVESVVVPSWRWRCPANAVCMLFSRLGNVNEF